MPNLNDGVAAIEKSNGKLDGFLEDTARVVAHDEVDDEISCTVTVQVTLALDTLDTSHSCSSHCASTYIAATHSNNTVHSDLSVGPMKGLQDTIQHKPETSFMLIVRLRLRKLATFCC